MTQSNVSAPTRKLDFSRILEVLLHPQRTFSLIAEEAQASWLTPMLVLSVSAFLSILVSGYLTSRAAMMGEVQLPRDWQYWTPDMQSNYMQAQQAMQGPVFSYIIPLITALIGLWLWWLILSGLLHLGSTLLGGRGSMQMALNIVGWAALPFVVRDFLRIIFMLLAGHSITSPGLSGFAGSAVFISQILTRVDIFFIWNCILLIIGFGISENLSKNRVVVGVVSVVVLLLLIQSGLGSLLSSVSGLAVQRPFF
ncbi:MAG: YIP1 family protein [Anaerolineales bacterium]|nr:YIP1 family protein [Anaerolineales bacterium]